MYRSSLMPTSTGDAAAFHTLARGEHGAALDDQLGVVKREAELSNAALAFSRAFMLFEPSTTDNEAHSIAERRGDQTVTRRVGVAGFQAVDAWDPVQASRCGFAA